MESVSTLHTFFSVFTAVFLSLILVVGSTWWVVRLRLQPKVLSLKRFVASFRPSVHTCTEFPSLFLISR